MTRHQVCDTTTTCPNNTTCQASTSLSGYSVCK
jgi:hypothetical protein